MNVAIWDTYVPRKGGGTMHFDIVVPADMKDPHTIFAYGKQYLRSKNQDGQPLASNECTFCHIEEVRPNWQADIDRQGFAIIEIEDCGERVSKD